jgi:gliding motility-associated-like protein
MLEAVNPDFGCEFELAYQVNVFRIPTSGQFGGLKEWHFLNEPPVQLSGNPSGGTFAGNGISGNSFDPALAGLGTHTITYSVSDGEGCTDEVVTVVEVFPPVVVYQAVTPNGDGMNDFFTVQSLEYIPDHQLKIFNRWGNLVYETTGYQNDWDGGDLPDGSYYYILTSESLGLEFKDGFIILR